MLEGKIGMVHNGQNHRYFPFKDLIDLVEEVRENPRKHQFHQFRNKECIKNCPQIQVSPKACPKCGLKLGLVCSPYGFGFICGHCEYILLRQWQEQGETCELVFED